MIKVLSNLTRPLLLAMLTIALLSVPFAHRVGAAPVDADMSAFLAVGGQYQDICGETAIHPAGGCESCRISGAMLLVKPATVARPNAMRLITRTLRADCSRPVSRVLVTPPVRAPPRA